jgi:hypothetical protein
VVRAGCPRFDRARHRAVRRGVQAGPLAGGAERSWQEADNRGLLAAWLADECRLGRSAEAWKQVEAAYSRGEPSAPRVDPLWPAGQKYLDALRSFLVKTGYAPSG